jgi:hypothetical protein
MNNAQNAAFPYITANSEGQTCEHECGLTKREYFVAKVIQGLLANSELLKTAPYNFKIESEVIKSYAKDAVMIADELLKQLEQPINS